MAKTSKMSSSAYVGTVELILRSKSKSLSVQGFSDFQRANALLFSSAKFIAYNHLYTVEAGHALPAVETYLHPTANHQEIIFLTVCHFFDALSDLSFLGGRFLCAKTAQILLLVIVLIL